MPQVLVQLDGVVGTLTLNHPTKRNALGAELIAELISGLEQMRSASARAVILRAPAGATVWSAGHDVRELPPPGRDPLGWDDPLRRVVRAIENFPAPMIALVEGSVWGGACELALTCDLIVASPDSTFAITPAKLGVPYNLDGMLNLMKSVDMQTLKEMLFTAQPISAERALRAGMINHIVARADIERFTLGLAGQIAETAPLCVALIKQELHTLSESRPLTPESFERLQNLRQRVSDSADYREGVRAFLEKRKPVFTGDAAV
jgi:methylmalonyl-CoA decarboxylase